MLERPHERYVESYTELQVFGKRRFLYAAQVRKSILKENEMDVQELERNAEVRIKFASINEFGGYNKDAGVEYQAFFPQKEGPLEQEWVYKKVDKLIETRFEYNRHAWVLTHTPTQTQIAAVEHETGIAILTGIVSGVGTAAVVSLVKWAWQKWKSARASIPQERVESGIVREKVTERFPDGRIRTVERLELRAPLDPEIVNRCIEQSFGAL